MIDEACQYSQKEIVPEIEADLEYETDQAQTLKSKKSKKRSKAKSTRKKGDSKLANE